MRNTSLDIARMLFAFLVVAIHVPLLGKSFINPLACCAVPFFYILSGYFIYNQNSTLLELNIKKGIKNYFRIYILYFIILTGLVTFLKFYFGEKLVFTQKDFVDLFFIYGNCNAVDYIEINGQGYGTSALWFLYAGGISMYFLFLTKKFFKHKLYMFFILLFYVVYTFINYKGEYIIPRILIPIPYIYGGIMLHLFLEKRNIATRRWRLFYITLFCIVALYMEQLLFHCQNYARLFLLPASICIFTYILSLPLSFTWGGYSRVSLDIYIWHRMFYFVVAGLFNINMFGFDAIIVFLSLFAISHFVHVLFIKITSSKSVS